MNKSMKAIAILVVVSSLFTLSGCSFLADLLSTLASPTLYVYDARNGTGIANVVVTLTPTAVDEGTIQDAVIAMSNSSGYVIFPDVEYGEYSVTAALSGYTFIPMDVTVAGWNQELGTLYGVAASGDTADAVAIFLTWGETSKDIDAHLTYPTYFDVGQTLAARTPWTATTAYYDFDEVRSHVYYGNQQDGAGLFAELDADDQDGPGPETISLYGSRTGSATGLSITVDATTPYLGGVIPNGSYQWMGAAEYYLHAYTYGSSLDDQDVKVIITQGTAVKGVFTVPRAMAVSATSLFRVHLFYQGLDYFMVFMPDVRLINPMTSADTTAFRGFAIDSAFVVSGTR